MSARNGEDVHRVSSQSFAWFVIGICGLLTATARGSETDQPKSKLVLTAQEQRFFESKIRPVLVKHCQPCHSSQADDVGGGLYLDSREGLRRGGQSGPAISAEAPHESLLLDALRYEGLEMPPEAPLPEAVVNDFVTWLEMGAPDPRAGPDPRAAAANRSQTPDGLPTEHWSFQPPVEPPIPSVQTPDWTRDPIDHFVLHRIEAVGLAPTGDAAPEVLLRRLCYDLTGLPPTLEQREAFLADHARRGPAAVAQLVDDLLASPSFGERWGRHWLDVARYGESNGNDGLSRNPTFPHAWRYRDYVIDAFNEDVPYDRFVTEQIAGDLLPAETPEQRDRQLVATGFLALAAKPAKAMNTNFDMDVVADQIDVVGTAIMGLSVACARCHDHKHDPIPTSDYYALAGIFSSTETMWGLAANEKLTAPATPLHELQTARPAPNPDEKSAAKKEADNAALAMGVRDRKKVADCKINIQGESGKLGPQVPRGFLSACSIADPPKIGAESSGRLELAQWLTRPDHPQTARVIVNRIWLHLFGQAIVATPDDFGIYGAEPSHPQLLDHLALRFQRQGWSIKEMIRSIVLSRSYQRSSWCDADTWRADPDNRLYARHLRRRLDAESLRDSILQVSGALDARPGQGSAVAHLDVLVNKHDSLHRPSRHRSIYLCMLRNSPPPELAAFDLPDGTRPQGSRSETTLPTQALFLLNNPLLVKQSREFAKRVLASGESTSQGRARWAYRCALQREPRDHELKETLGLVQAMAAASPNDSSEAVPQDVRVWASVCQALLASNEFRYID